MRRILLPSRVSCEPLYGKSMLWNLEGRSMGTSWAVRAIGRDDRHVSGVRAGIQRQLDSVVAQMSHWERNSCLGCFNLAPEGAWHSLPEPFFKVLEYGLSIAEETDGAYNPASGALVNLWGFGPHGRYDKPGFSMPTPAAVEAALKRSDWRAIEIDRAARRARQSGGTLLDLSSIAKGYAVDAVTTYLEEEGIRHYLVEIGGELRGAGMKPDGHPWWVALESPEAIEQDDNAKEIAPIIAGLHGLAVATSGDYRRYFRQDGRFCPHTIDPRTGYPIDNGIASVTVVHEECMAADALSTALTVLGIDEGMHFAEERGIAARFLVRRPQGFAEHMTSRFLSMLE